MKKILFLLLLITWFSRAQEGDGRNAEIRCREKADTLFLGNTHL